MSIGWWMQMDDFLTLNLQAQESQKLSGEIMSQRYLRCI